MTRLIELTLWCVVLWGSTATTTAAAATMDHRTWTTLLGEHVQNGRVDYAAFAQDPRLDAYLDELARTDPATLSSEAEQLAFWINAYNAYTVKLVADDYPVRSIHDLGTGGRIIGWLLNRTPWDIRFATIGGQDMTLNEIEHEVLRVEFDEPRIHFAIVCAAVSCPLLRTEAYTAEKLEEQLNEQARQFLRDGINNRFDLANREARLSSIFSWFKADFGGNDQAVLRFIADYAPPKVAADLKAHPDRWRLRHTHYDWSLNDQP